MGFWGDVGNSLGLSTGGGVQDTPGYTRPDQVAKGFDKRLQAAGPDLAPQTASREVLAGLAGNLGHQVGDLTGQINGTAPSISGLQLQQGNEAQQRNLLGALAAQRGMNPGAIAALATNAAAQGQQATNMAAAQAGIAERNAAMQQRAALEGLIGQTGAEMRQGDLSAAGLTQANEQFNVGQGNAMLGADLAAQNAAAQQQNQAIAQAEAERKARLQKTIGAIAGAASSIPGAIATGGASLATPGALTGGAK